MVDNGGDKEGGDGSSNFILQVLRGRWFVVFSSLLVLSSAGGAYVFGLYSNDIKSSLGYDQTTLNLLIIFKSIGCGVGIHPGLLMEVAPPWVVLAVGSGLNFFGYFMIWLAVTSRIAKPAVWKMCLYIFIGSNSQPFANTGALITCVKNFPKSRGAVLGLGKGFLGLSGAIITQVYHAIYGNNAKSLILLIAWLPSTISILSLPIIRFIKVVRQKNEMKFFYELLYISLGLAGFLMVMIIVQKRVSFDQSAYIGTNVVLLILLILPIVTVIKYEFMTRKNNGLDKISSVSNSMVNTEEQVRDQVGSTALDDVMVSSEVSLPMTQKEPSCFQTIFDPPNRGEDHTIMQALCSMDMIIIYLATMLGVGGTLSVVDNLGQIGTSLGYPTQSISTFVSLASIWSYLGRVMAGYFSDYLLKKYKFPRPLVFTFNLLLSCVGHLLVVINVPNGLYVASVIAGFCFGAQWPLNSAIIADIFGLKYYATLDNIGILTLPIGSCILSLGFMGYLYDREAIKQLKALGRVRKLGQELDCNGPKCFKLAFFIIMGATLFSAFVSLILVARTWKFYKSDIYKKFQEGENAAQVEMVDDCVLSMEEVKKNED